MQDLVERLYAKLSYPVHRSSSPLVYIQSAAGLHVVPYHIVQQLYLCFCQFALGKLKEVPGWVISINQRI